MNLAKKTLRRLLSHQTIAHLPVRVRRGIAEGASWTLFPWTSYWRGTHEPLVQSRIAGLMDWRGKSIWDLGAHYGLYAVGLGRRAGPTGQVAAFEPNPLSFGRLQLHFRRNHLNSAKAFPYAVSDQTQSQRFFLYEGLENTSTHLAYEDETWHEGIPSMMVQSVRLDDLVGRGEIRPPDFIKLDVEGHGHKALAGAHETLARSRPVIMAGIHSQFEIDGISNLLEPLAYRTSPIQPDAPATLTSGYDYLFEPLAS